MERWRMRIAMVGIATVAGLGFAEGVLRLTGLAPDPGIFTVTEAEFRRIPGIFAPGQEVVEARGTRFEHRTTINSLGYRGAELPRTPPQGEFRVFFAGDSFTWGHNVGDHETLPARLEERLAERCPGGTRVINAGLSGSTILAQAAMVERGLVLEPDQVVVMFHENDIDELMYTRMWELLAVNRRAKSRFPLSLVYPWARHTALWNLALSATQSRRINAAVLQDPDTPAPGAAVDGARAAALDEYARRGRAMKERLEQLGIPLLYVTFPHPESVRRGEGGDDYRWALEWARSEGIATVDLLGPFLESGIPVEEAYLVPEDYHPSPGGHALAAGILADALLRGPDGPPSECSGG